MAEVELDISSGMPNPRWTLNANETSRLVETLRSQGSQVQSMQDQPNGLGYRGFVVYLNDHESEAARLSGQPSAFRVGASGGLDPGTLTQLLMRGAEQASIQQEVVDVAQAAIDSPSDTVGTEEVDDEEGATGSGCRLFLTSSSDFTFWENNQSRNNCYNYASNIRTNTFALPGRANGRSFHLGGSPYEQKTRLLASMAADGWGSGCGTAALYVAAAIWPGHDFHFWRRVRKSQYSVAKPWAHKPGQWSVRTNDSSFHQISSPYHCDRGNYTYWCGTRYASGLRIN